MKDTYPASSNELSEPTEPVTTEFTLSRISSQLAKRANGLLRPLGKSTEEIDMMRAQHASLAAEAPSTAQRYHNDIIGDLHELSPENYAVSMTTNTGIHILASEMYVVEDNPLGAVKSLMNAYELSVSDQMSYLAIESQLKVWLLERLSAMPEFKMIAGALQKERDEVSFDHLRQSVRALGVTSDDSIYNAFLKDMDV